MLIYLDSILYIILTAISFVFIDKMGENIHPVLSLFIMSILATICFNLINYKHLTMMYKSCIHHKKIYCSVAITVGVNWLSSIFAPTLSDPFIYLAIYFVTMAICALVSKILSQKINYLMNGLSIILLTCCFGVILFFYQMRDAHRLDLGMAFGIIGGISAYYYASFSNFLQQSTNFSSTQILAVRFWPLIISLGIYGYFQHLFILSLYQSIALFIMAIISLILPVFFLQQAVRKLGVIRYAIVVSLTPVCTFILYSLSSNNLNFINLLICSLITVALIISKLSFTKSNSVKITQ